MVINDNVSLEDVAEENGDTNCLTEVDVSEKTIKFKISTDCNVGGGRKSYPGSRKGSRERVQCLNNSELTRIMQKGKLRKGALSFDQHCSFASKKLSFDSPEFLDEYAITLMKKFNNFPGDVREDVDDEEGECDLKKTRSFNRRNSQQHAWVTKDANAYEDEETSSPGRAKSIVNNGNLDETPDGVKLLQKAQHLDDVGIGTATNDLKILNNGDYPEPKTNRSLLQRFKQFTDRFASSDKDSKKQFKFSFAKNNNVAGNTLPSSNRKKLENVCCKSLERVDDDRRASTLPKTKKTTSLKKGWKLLLPKKGKPSGRLDGWASDVNVNANKLECGLLDNDTDNQSLPSTSKSQSNCTLNVSPKRSARDELRAEEAPSAHHVSPIKRQPKSEYPERRSSSFKAGGGGGGGHRAELKKGARPEVLVKSSDLI